MRVPPAASCGGPGRSGRSGRVCPWPLLWGLCATARAVLRGACALGPIYRGQGATSLRLAASFERGVCATGPVFRGWCATSAERPGLSGPASGIGVPMHPGAGLRVQRRIPDGFSLLWIADCPRAGSSDPQSCITWLSPLDWIRVELRPGAGERAQRSLLISCDSGVSAPARLRAPRGSSRGGRLRGLPGSAQAGWYGRSRRRAASLPTGHGFIAAPSAAVTGSLMRRRCRRAARRTRSMRSAGARHVIGSMPLWWQGGIQLSACGAARARRVPRRNSVAAMPAV